MFEVIIGRKNTKKFNKNNIIEQIPDKITTKQQINNVSTYGKSGTKILFILMSLSGYLTRIRIQLAI